MRSDPELVRRNVQLGEFHRAGVCLSIIRCTWLFFIVLIAFVPNFGINTGNSCVDNKVSPIERRESLRSAFIYCYTDLSLA